MPIDSVRCCRCHGVPMIGNGGRHYCAVKRRVTWARAVRRYRQTANGKAAAQRSNAHRIFVGRTYHSWGDTTETAAAINRHIRSKLQAYATQQRQSQRAEMESLPTSGVPIEASLGTDRLGGRDP